MDDKEGKITITNELGESKEFDVLFTFDSDETKKSYIAYTDNSLDDEGNVKVYASTWDPTGKDLSIKPIESQKEWKIIESILSSIQEKLKEAEENGK
jgi:uncharacterized protein YrzB (UPF0473 family)